MDTDRLDVVPRSLHPNSRRRLSLLAPSLALMAALLIVSPALSALRIGTNGGETLTGTNGADELTGKGGNDTLRGLAGNDVYFFRDGWGDDTLDDQKKYGKKSGGIDTLNFSRVTFPLEIHMNIQQWGPHHQRVGILSGNTIWLGTSVVEKAVGGQAGDQIFGGAEANTLQPGGGTTDFLTDYGGWNGAIGLSALPASNDTYKGFTDNTGSDYISDWGGTADVLDMRPFSTDDVYIERIDIDEDAEEESLAIVTKVIPGTPPTDIGVIVIGQFGEYYQESTVSGMHGQIEKLIFADRTISPSTALGMTTSATAQAEGGETLERAKGGETAEMAAAERMATAARADLERNPLPIAVHGNGRGGDSGNAAPGPGDGGKHRDSGSKAKAKKDQKHDKHAKKREQKDKSDKPDKRHGLQHRTERLGQRDLGLRGRAWGQEQGGSQ